MTPSNAREGTVYGCDITGNSTTCNDLFDMFYDGLLDILRGGAVIVAVRVLCCLHVASRRLHVCTTSSHKFPVLCCKITL